MTKIPGLKPRALPSRLDSGSWVGLKPGFPWTQEKDHLVIEFIFQRSEEEIWKKPSLCSNVSPSVLVSSSSPLGDPLPRASRASHLLLSAAFLCHLQPWLSAWKGPEVTSCSYSSGLPEFTLMALTRGHLHLSPVMRRSLHPSSSFYFWMALALQSSLQCQPHLNPEGAVFWEFHLVIQLPSPLRGRVSLKPRLLQL